MSQTTARLQAWIDRRTAGGAPSLDELIRLCEERVRELIRPRLNSFPAVRRQSQTTDILDETFLRLFPALDAKMPPTPRNLFQLVAFKIRQVLLDRQKRRPPGEALADPAEAADGHPMDDDTMAAFHQYVHGLPAGDRAVFDLLYYHGQTPEQAAGCLGWSVVKTRRAWLKARLRVATRFGPENPI